jgi:hypothetical protein
MVLTPIDYADIPNDIYIHRRFREALMEHGIIEEIEEKILNSLNNQSLNLSDEIFDAATNRLDNVYYTCIRLFWFKLLLFCTQCENDLLWLAKSRSK